MDYVTRSSIQVGADLAAFIETEALPTTTVAADSFWQSLADLVNDFGPRNRALLETRAAMQASIDRWHQEHPGPIADVGQYRTMLENLGYLVPPGPDFKIQTANVDEEISTVAGPQLVVPLTNARYALNAANARWGSLYDALYGTDAVGSPPPSGPYSAERGAKVIAWGRSFLDQAVPLASGSHADVERYSIEGQKLMATTVAGQTGLADPQAFVGFTGKTESPETVLLRNNGLHIELAIDHDGRIGRDDRAGIDDVILESALTAIIDCEDSVAAVDTADKVHAYRNWLGLMTRELTEEVDKGQTTITRRLSEDRRYSATDGSDLVLSGTATMLVRNVGHLMTTPAVLDSDGNEAFEGLLDAMVTTLCAMVDVGSPGGNSSTGSIYVVKPKMHGPEEVRFTNEVFAFVEESLGLAANTVKIGVMDEERRTTLNLSECLREVSERVVFINTGFLDRTGDEIRTSTYAGPFVPKSEMKAQAWISAYEDRNVQIGLHHGLRGRAQIGKGMWAAPNRMADMLDQKIGHPRSGATCAWVPSPTAATLHATHYHQVDVGAVQDDLAQQHTEQRRQAPLEDLLTIPVLTESTWTPKAIQEELENNAQGILGYVVRWIDQGIGCSTVPDINGVGLMEDRATCRISSQHIANWLLHGVVSAEQVESTFRNMAEMVDGQNADDPNYRPMSPSFDGAAYSAARDLVFSGVEQPSGYTEPILHARRLQAKETNAR